MSNWKDKFPKEDRYFETENGILYYADCLEILPLIPDKSIDLILTDPPYNLSERSSIINRKGSLVGIDEPWDKDFNPEKYFYSMFRTLNPKGNMFVFCANNLLCKWRNLFDKNFDIQLIFVWIKTNPTPQFRKVSFLKATEFIVCGWNKGHKWKFKTQREMVNVFLHPAVGGKERIHPTQKPIALIKHLIEIASFEKDIVLDPFLGSGTTAIACEKLNRRWIGIEIDKTFCEVAKKRISKETRQLKLNFSQ